MTAVAGGRAVGDLRGGTLLQHPRVLVAIVACQENTTSLSTDPPCSQVPGLSKCMHVATGTS